MIAHKDDHAAEEAIVIRMQQAAEEYDWRSLTGHAEAYARRLHASATMTRPRVTQILDLLLESQQYDALMSVADAALANHPDEQGIWRRYAQALIDQKRTAAALRIYTDVFEDPRTPDDERIEARGGIGRCYKQLFLTTTASDRRAEYLRRSLHEYLGMYTEDRQQFWHGINAAALLVRADHEGISVRSTSEAGQRAREIATRVLKTLNARPQSDRWSKAIACEAHLALGEIEPALQCGAAFVEDRDTDAFAIASLLRQLLDVWELDTTTRLGNALLPILRSALLEKHGGSVVVEGRDVSASRLKRLDTEGLEAVLGVDRYNSLTWYRNGLRRCQAVARIENRNQDGIGTGFLVAGGELHPSLPHTILVTNGHVIPERLDPRNAVVVFHGLDADTTGPKRFRVLKRWWYEPSSSPRLDTALVELDGSPPGVENIPVASPFPTLTANSRAYVIGHPRGLEQPQFSLQDNLVLDHDDTRLHYRSPTEPGSSGSPVFDGQWELIGLHHAGGLATARLHGARGTYAANEALIIDAIRHKLAESPPLAVDAD